MNDELKKLILENADSIAVSHLWTFYRDKDSSEFLRNPSLDYHLHFISFKDEESIGYVCLDTGDYLVSDKETFGNNVKRALLQALIHSFIDKLSSYLHSVGNQNEEDSIKKFILNKCPIEIWEKFNQIKNDSFFSGLKGLSNYLGTKTIGKSVKESSFNEIQSKPETYGDFKFEILEERALSRVS